MEIKSIRLLMIGNLQQNEKINPTVCDELSQLFTKQGLTVITASRKANKLIKLIDMVSTCLIRKNDYQVALIDVYSSLAFIWAEVISGVLRWLGKRYVLILHGGSLPSFASRQPKRLGRLLRRADLVVAPSEYLRSKILKFRPDIKLIHNPLDIGRYKFNQRRKLTPSLVWVRAFHRIYNPCMVLQVVDILRERYPSVHLTMVGPDKHDGSLGDFIREHARLDLEDHVSLLGSISKIGIPNILQRANIFINSSNVDNMPVSVLEAMACGLCIISTNVGGIPFLLENEKDALLVPPNDPKAMSAAIRRLLMEPDLAESLSANARKKAEKFDWSVILPQWEELFLEVIGGHREIRANNHERI